MAVDPLPVPGGLGDLIEPRRRPAVAPPVAVEKATPPSAPRVNVGGITAYGRVALDAIEAEASAVPAGLSGKDSRHHALYTRSIRGGNLVAGGEIPGADVVEAAMLRAAWANGYAGPAPEGYGEQAALDVIRDGIARGLLKAESAPERTPRRKTTTQEVAPVEMLDEDVVLEEPAHLRDEDPNAASEPPHELHRAVNLYDESIVPTRPAFAVANLIRLIGLHLWWAEPSAGKTWTLLYLVHVLLSRFGTGKLFRHPDLWINSRWNRVLWIATEEDAPTLRYKAEWVRKGLGIEKLDGELLYMFAAATPRITLDHLPEIIRTEGPIDAIVLDSLTGLRPKTVNGDRVRWDVDNDAANEMCLRLRALATEHKVAIFLIHHSDKTGANYRGPTDWWASADVMLGLSPDGGRTKVTVQKNRDGRRVAPFLLEPTWHADDSYTLEYSGAALGAKLNPTALKVHAFMEGARTATQNAIIEKVGCARSTGVDAIKLLVSENLLLDTGAKQDRSPVYRIAEVSEVSGEVSGGGGRE